MNARFQQLLVAPLLAMFAGCGVEQAENATGEPRAAAEMELFDKNRGVHLPPDLRRDLGVATAEVTGKSVTPRIEKQAQVYREARNGLPAAAMVWLNETEAKFLQSERDITVRVPGPEFPDSAGKLVRLEPSFAAAPGQVEALIEFDDAGQRCAVGTSVAVTFAGASPRAALAAPQSAVIHGADGPFVYAANGEHFTRAAVKLGAARDGWVEITDGLYTGDVVATNRVEALWLIELCAIKGGSPCCPAPMKDAGKKD